MIKHCRYCALILGALLVLLAMGLALRVQSTITTAPASSLSRAEVAQAVSELQGGCFTCHTTRNDLPADVLLVEITQIRQLEHSPYHTRQSAKTLPVAFSNAQVNAQLVDLGQRILVLPRNNNQHVEQVSAEFIQVYEQTITTPDQVIVPNVLQQIDSVEALLRILENQALPHTLKQHDPSPFQTKTIDSHQPSPGGLGTIGLSQYTLLSNIEGDEDRLLDPTPRSLPQDIVFATRRRGPPAVDGALLDSVCTRRLSSVDAQSPFMFLGAVRVPQRTLSQS